jgi:serine/threonine-protein kinase RsbT
VVLKQDTLPVRTPEDVVRVRQAVRSWAVEIGLNLIDQTKIVTAASEIARNTLDYGGGGDVQLQHVHNGIKKGLRLTFEDKGPGIADIEKAMRDGYTTGSGLGLGLSGAKRLSSEFEISSKPGEGTRISLTRWKT